MKYKYIVKIEPKSPVAARTLDDAINYIADIYNNSITKKGFDFEKEYPRNNIIYGINKNEIYSFFDFDYVMTIDKYIEDYIDIVGE